MYSSKYKIIPQLQVTLCYAPNRVHVIIESRVHIRMWYMMNIDLYNYFIDSYKDYMQMFVIA